MARRADGQMVQMSDLLFFVAEQVDGAKTYEQIAEGIERAHERKLSSEDVGYLIEKKLRPLGIVAGLDGKTKRPSRVDPLLALKFRHTLVPEGAVRVATSVLRPLFFPPVMVAVFVALVAFDIWFFFEHGVAQSFRQVMYQPGLFASVFALMLATTLFHEFGHATGCRYGGGKPGKIGFGLYLIWPAFYTDVTDSYRLSRWGRLRTDIGGVYFNSIFILAIAAAHWYFRAEWLLIVVLLVHIEMLHQFMPFLRLDGYYIISDLTGVPDLFARIKPILKSLSPFKRADEKVKELKPWVRTTVTIWTLLVVPFLLFNLLMMITHFPRLTATAYDSGLKQYDKAYLAFADGSHTEGVVNVMQILLLALPVLGMAMIFWQLGKKTANGVWTWTEGKPVLRGAALTVGAAAMGFVAYTLMPNGDYTPIREGETWTVSDVSATVPYVASGRAGLVHRPIYGTQDPEVLDPIVPVSEQPAPDQTPLPDQTPTPEQSPTEPAAPSPSPSPSESPTATP